MSPVSITHTDTHSFTHSLTHTQTLLHTHAQAAVEREAKMCVGRLALAERLVGGLADENTRWGANVADLQGRLKNLTGDVLLGAAFVSYIGAFNSSFRSMLWTKKWLPDLINRQIPLTAEIDPLTVRSTSRLATRRSSSTPSSSSTCRPS